MPLPLLHAMAALCASVAMWIPSRARATTERNLTLCFPQLSGQQRRSLIQSSLKHTYCTAFEMGKAWVAPLSSTLGQVKSEQGMSLLREALASGRGVILLAPHLSNWEFFGFYACEGVASHFMYQPPKIAAMDRLLKQTRSRSGVSLAPTNSRGVAQLLKALRAGELVGVLPDQVPATEGGVYADFFGHRALTMTLISKLLQRTDAVVLCGYARRLESGKGFEVIIEAADPEIYSESIEQSARALNRSIESLVKRSPEQYQWEYKRFRRQPDNVDVYSS